MKESSASPSPSPEEQVRLVRHSLAHLTAAAAKSLWPGAQNAIGPAIENGFYQDFDFATHKISEHDLPALEKRMREILKTWGAFKEREVSATEARKLFADNQYKLELIDGLVERGETITVNDPGNFIDLCKGGHSENPQKDLQHFKLLSLAGAFWRGDEKKKMLTRVYGTAFLTKIELQEHLTMLTEAKKRDHKKLGVDLDLFTFSDLVGSGLPLWTPKGAILRDELDAFVWELRKKCGYQKVEIPHITKKDLYETSGHWDKYKDDLFRIKTREGHEFAMKPMNCPHHTQIYARKQWSYRELPQRYANTTMCYRDEQTGELSGLSRLRSFTQDDAHVFCRISQAEVEIQKIWDIVHTFYSTFGLKLRLRLSLRDPDHPEKYLGNQEHWDKAEAILRNIAQANQTEYFEAPGEAAFYAPKLDFLGKDSIGREWQLATIQLDVNMPDRFDLTCIAENGEKERIVMIHAAIMGATERFMSIMIEHLAGAFPIWLAPVQVKLLPVGLDHQKFSQQLADEFTELGLRVEIDLSGESVGKKIRESSKQKIPFVVVLGDKEMKSDELAVRVRGQEEVLNIKKTSFVTVVQESIKKRNLELHLG